jgi:hypothetical protein
MEAQQRGGEVTEEERVINGHGAWRITLQGGGIVKFECWDFDDNGETVAYYSAGKAKEDT